MGISDVKKTFSLKFEKHEKIYMASGNVIAGLFFFFFFLSVGHAIATKKMHLIKCLEIRQMI